MDGSGNTIGTHAEKDETEHVHSHTQSLASNFHICLCENETVQTLDTGTGHTERSQVALRENGMGVINTGDTDIKSG